MNEAMRQRVKEIAIAAVLAGGAMLVMAKAHASPRHHRHHHYVRHYRHVDANGNDPRPAAWCGYYLRHALGVADRAYNLARNWAHYGNPAGGPRVGAIVVWPHHVGIITGRTNSGWIVKSGNDGHRVRERERSLRGAIAFREP